MLADQSFKGLPRLWKVNTGQERSIPLAVEILARLLAEMKYGGTVAAIGLTGGSELLTKAMPFILRAIKLVGVEVATCPVPLRKKGMGAFGKGTIRRPPEASFQGCLT